MNEEFIKSLSSAARVVGSDPEKTFAATITSSIEPNHLQLEMLRMFLDVRTLQPGDMYVRKIRKGLPVRTMVPGTNHLADQISMQEHMAFNIDYLIAKIKYSLWEIRRAEPQTLVQFRQDMENALVDAIVTRGFATLTTTWTTHNGGSNYLDASGTGLTETGLKTMQELILRRAGSVRAIVGTRAALMPIYNMAGFVTSPSANEFAVTSILEEYKRTGRVSQFYGTPVIELNQVYSRTIGNYETPMLPEDKVLVIGNSAGEVVLYGDTETQEHLNTEIEPADYTLAYWRGMGMIIDRPENIAVIKIA